LALPTGLEPLFSPSVGDVAVAVTRMNTVPPTRIAPTMTKTSRQLAEGTPSWAIHVATRAIDLLVEAARAGLLAAERGDDEARVGFARDPSP